jgi:spore coat polysaccharide biosynthesis protein SpsF
MSAWHRETEMNAGRGQAKNVQARVVAIIQARMGSSRLPGKVLAEIEGRPMLWRVLERARAAQSLSEVMVATTGEPRDDAIVDLCRQHGVVCFRGSEADVLDRYYHAAKQQGADFVARITSDCPLIDSEIIDQVVREFLAGDFDYASNGLTRTYPRGLDIEVMTFEALQRAHAEARPAYQRAHVTPFIYENPTRFKILAVTGAQDYSELRWTVDTPEDLAFVRAIYQRLENQNCGWREIVKLLELEPQLAGINASIAQKALHEG